MDWEWLGGDAQHEECQELPHSVHHHDGGQGDAVLCLNNSYNAGIRSLHFIKRENSSLKST